MEGTGLARPIADRGWTRLLRLLDVRLRMTRRLNLRLLDVGRRGMMRLLSLRLRRLLDVMRRGRLRGRLKRLR